MYSVSSSSRKQTNSEQRSDRPDNNTVPDLSDSVRYKYCQTVVFCRNFTACVNRFSGNLIIIRYISRQLGNFLRLINLPAVISPPTVISSTTGGCKRTVLSGSIDPGCHICDIFRNLLLHNCLIFIIVTIFIDRKPVTDRISIQHFFSRRKLINYAGCRKRVSSSTCLLSVSSLLSDCRLCIDPCSSAESSVTLWDTRFSRHQNASVSIVVPLLPERSQNVRSGNAIYASAGACIASGCIQSRAITCSLSAFFRHM